MTKVVEIIDVDALSDSSSSDSDIVLTGFKRNPAKSQAHTEMLETEGFVYTGFNETPMPPPLCKASSSSQPLRRASHSSSKTPESDRPHAATAVSRISTGNAAVSRGVYSRQPTERHTTLAPLEPTKRSPSTFNPGRPTKRQKLTHVPTITNPQLKRERSVMKSESRKEPVDSEVICISDSEDEQPAPKKPTLLSSPSSRNDCTRNGRVVPSNKPTAHTPSELEDPMDVDQQEEEDYATAHAALDLDYRANWGDLDDGYDQHVNVHGDDSSEDDELVLRIAALAVAESSKKRAMNRIARRQQQSSIFDWSKSQDPCKNPHISYLGKQVFRVNNRRQRSQWYHDFSRWTRLRPVRCFKEAPGDINTIAQGNGMIVMASAVSDGAMDDLPGPYNSRGSLVVSIDGKEYIMDNHSKMETAISGSPQQHYYTVNDVAIDPSSPRRFASAGRDKRVLFWNCERIQDGEAPELIDEFECDDNPEVVKYHPDGSILAIQCDDGSVYLHTDRYVNQAIVAPAGRGHVTAEMAWGVHASRNLLFASSACQADASGHHKVFDVVRNKVVVEFDAGREACSSLALDPLGERLYIATECADSSFVLRQFDARTRDRKPAQKAALEPFAPGTDKASMEINALALSADGLYLAAARTDNWADVYDARMLAKGPLHSFAHEDAVSGARDNYGVVKAQWVDGRPRGVGLVTGGSDGCVRLWDVRRAADDPLNGTVLARGDYDVATFNLGDMYDGEKPIIVGERSGKVTIFDHAPSSN